MHNLFFYSSILHIRFIIWVCVVGLMDENPMTRRKAVKAISATGIALAFPGIGQSAANPCHPIEPGCGDDGSGHGNEREESTQVESYTGGEMRGNGDFTITNASTVIEHRPLWTESIGKWQCDISVSGIADCRFVDDNSPAEEMWWHRCDVMNQQFGKDLYTRRNDSDWSGLMIGDGNSSVDYEDKSAVHSAIALGLGVLNPAAGTAYSAGILLSNMLEKFGDPLGPGAKYDVDSALRSPQEHHTGYYHMYRAELASNEVTIHDVRDMALAYPEYPAANTFEVIMGAPPSPPEASASELREYGITRYAPNEIGLMSEKDPRVAQALVEHDSPVYVANRWRGSIEPKPGKSPAKLREEYGGFDREPTPS